MINANKEVFEMTTSGISCSPLASQFEPERDFALYRIKEPLTDEQKARMQEFFERRLAQQRPFSYLTLAIMFLQKKYKLFKGLRLASVADIAYREKFQLIGYC